MSVKTTVFLGWLAIVVTGCTVDSSIPLGSERPDGPLGPPTCPQTFSACGGDLTGTWKLASFCGTQPAPTFCSTATTTISFTGTETTTFNAGSMVTSKMDTYIYTTDASSCLAGATTCESIAAQMPSQTCAPTSGSACVCTQSLPVSSQSTFSYTVSGSALTYSQGGSGSYFSQFCVEGNALTISTPASPIVELYERQ